MTTPPIIGLPGISRQGEVRSAAHMDTDELYGSEFGAHGPSDAQGLKGYRQRDLAASRSNQSNQVCG